MDPILIFTSFLVVVWTIKLARSKQRHPWLWGGAALALSIIPGFSLLSVIPVVVLMFLKRREDGLEAGPVSPACPKCDTIRSHDQPYCINCGWELSRPYLGEPQTADEQASVPLGSQYTEPQAATAESASMQSAEPESQPMAEAVSTSQGGTTPPEPVLQAGPTESPQEEPAEPEVRRHRGVPTASGMTQWGIDLFDLGRIQESIDQFTKAIALDPSFKMAWERRAESYAKMGRGEEAAEDRRRLSALNATPSAG
ncbi:MAG: hypothetical protein BZY88_04750 [SAR202 cluster bacterium Io17-Chloro-G9]|nr:MAG: hypothetical protein BZY88_04750 [SAR202 cluster bacterium Io17-Chloro-G9]